ncbi:hypothetical protein RhoFasB10_03479 [Rhodococcus sp. B10]|nr:hypothetical protein [Rhodococcus sp. B10]
MLPTSVESELAARDASNIVNRLKAAAFPVTETLESFDIASSSIQPKVFDYMSSLEWVRTQSNLAIIGPAGSVKSHTLIGLGVAAIHAGHKVPFRHLRPRQQYGCRVVTHRLLLKGYR